MSERILIVGETNPYGSNPDFALYHLPRHASGNRLREHLGLPDHVYGGIQKLNLCQGQWGMKSARESAETIETVSLWPVIVMLGSKVKSAFHLQHLPFFQAIKVLELTYISLPHPSGLNRIWNTPGVRFVARDLLRQHAPEVAWGSTTSGT